MFGIGPMELLIVLIVGLFTLGIPIAIIVFLVLLLRQRNNVEGDAELISQLRGEIQHLRDELAAGRKT